MDELDFQWRATSREEYPWYGRPHGGKQRLSLAIGTYFIQCNEPGRQDLEWWNGTKGSNGGPGLKLFGLYAESEMTPHFRWPFEQGKGDPIAECCMETPSEAEEFFARWLLELATEALEQRGVIVNEPRPPKPLPTVEEIFET